MFNALLFQIFLFLLFPPSLPGLHQADARVVRHLPSVAEGPVVLRNADVAAPEISARAAGVWDPRSSSWIYEKNAEGVFPIASTTKLMTALVALEHGFDMDDAATITSDDNDPEGSRLYLSTGAVVTVRDLFFSALVGSANNATEALVRVTGMREADFVAAMNDKAASLGMSATHFTDVTGLGSKNVSSVHDMALLAQAAFARPEIVEATTTTRYTVNDTVGGKTVVLTNTNKLVGSDMRVTAGKTGFTDAAGGVLISRIRGIGEHELLIITLESVGREERFSDVRALADWAFATHTWREE